MLITTGSFRSHRTYKSNDQYSLVVVMLYLLQNCSIKISINGNSQHFLHMVLQISRTYDFDRKFLEKRCGLYAGFYHKTFPRLKLPGFENEEKRLQRNESFGPLCWYITLTRNNCDFHAWFPLCCPFYSSWSEAGDLAKRGLWILWHFGSLSKKLTLAIFFFFFFFPIEKEKHGLKRWGLFRFG